MFMFRLSVFVICLHPVTMCLTCFACRLIRLKGRYRNLMNTLIELRPRFVSLFILFMIIYYAFAIIGLEFFAFKVEQGCCNTSWYHVGEFYSAKVDPPGALNDTNTPKVYYLNNFDNILRSYGESVNICLFS